MPVSTARLRRALPLLFGLLSASAGAQEILIGHVAGYTGPVMKDATEMGAGAKVLVDAVNSRGGVLGRKVRILVADDNCKPEETAKLIASMSGKVSALLPTTGSANLGLVLKNGVFDKITLPLVGTIPSNESFRTPLRKNIFHFRAGDQAQLEKIVEQLTTVGIKDIAVLARNNPSGAEGAVIIQDALQKRGLKLVAHATYDVAAKDGWAPQVKMMTENKPGAIILLGTPQGIADVAKALRAGGVSSLLYAVSYADFKLIAKVGVGHRVEQRRNAAGAQRLRDVSNALWSAEQDDRAGFVLGHHFHLRGPAVLRRNVVGVIRDELQTALLQRVLNDHRALGAARIIAREHSDVLDTDGGELLDNFLQLRLVARAEMEDVLSQRRSEGFVARNGSDERQRDLVEHAVFQHQSEVCRAGGGQERRDLAAHRSDQLRRLFGLEVVVCHEDANLPTEDAAPGIDGVYQHFRARAHFGGIFHDRAGIAGDVPDENLLGARRSRKKAEQERQGAAQTSS